MKKQTRARKICRICCLLIGVMLLSLCGLTSCGGDRIAAGTPELAAVRAEFEDLINASAEANRILFGSGPEVYEVGSAEAAALGLYAGESEPAYLRVKLDEEVQSTADIRRMALDVYSPGYMEPILSVLLDGYYYEAEDLTVLSTADYYDSVGGLCVSAERHATALETRSYDLSTMKIVAPSNASRVTVAVDSFLPSNPSEHLTLHLVFLQTESGWRLDAPTY